MGEDSEVTPDVQNEIQKFVKSLGFSDARPSGLITKGSNEGKIKKNLDNFEKKDLTKPVTKATRNNVEAKTNGVVSKTAESKLVPGRDSEKDRTTVKKKAKWKIKRNENEGVEGRIPGAQLLIKTGIKWYENEFTDDPTEFPESSPKQVEQLRSLAEKLLEEDVARYSKRKLYGEQESDQRWIKTVISSGTSTDKMAAYTLLIQDSPIHNLTTLQHLVGMVKMGKKKDCQQAIDCLSEVFSSELLHPSRKLRSFSQHPLSKVLELSGGNHVAYNRRLIVWYFEDELKHQYQAFVNSLNTATHDTVEANRSKALTVMSNLLAENPEHEQVLLSAVVNKLGDPVNRVAAKCVFLLQKLISRHPNMAPVVVLDVERLLFRPNIGTKARFYGISFLTQILLSKEDSQLAGRLITIYFAFFKSCVKQGELDSRMMSALLTGVSRAFPYASVDTEAITEQVETMYRIVHLAQFNIAVGALCLLHQIVDSGESAADRFYCALYKKILDPQLANTNQQALFFSLIYRALKKDASENRIKAFIKRLLQVSLYLPTQLVCGILYLVSELAKDKPTLLVTDVKPVLMDSDDEEEKFIDVAELEDQENENHISQDVKPVKASWFHKANTNHHSNAKYDVNQRNPLYARAGGTAVWELKQLSQHQHPSCSLFAKTLLEGRYVEYSGDPLQDFTLIRFLDRFSFKNPKKPTEKATSSKKRDMLFARKKLYVPVGMKSLAVNSEEYLKHSATDVPPDELFMYRYLQKKQEEKEDKGDDESDSESVGSDEFDELMQKFIGGKTKQSAADFACDVSQPAKQKGQKRKTSVDDSDEEADDDMEDASEDDKDLFEDEDGASLGSVSDEEENFGGSENEDVDEIEVNQKGKSSKGISNLKQVLSKRMKSNKASDMFVSAEEFAEMLDEAGGSSFDSAGAGAMSNRDAADVKQLKWEMDRHKYVSHKRHFGRQSNKRGKKRKK